MRAVPTPGHVLDKARLATSLGPSESPQTGGVAASTVDFVIRRAGKRLRQQFDIFDVRFRAGRHFFFADFTANNRSNIGDFRLVQDFQCACRPRTRRHKLGIKFLLSNGLAWKL